MVDIPIVDEGGPAGEPDEDAAEVSADSGKAQLVVGETPDEVVLEIAGVAGVPGRKLMVKVSAEAAAKVAGALAEAARNVMKRQAYAGAHGKLAERNRA